MKTRLLDIDGSSIAVHETAGDGPTVVICHGNSSSSRAFRHQLDGELGRRLRIVAIDLPGHGESGPAASPASTYTLAGYARVLRQVSAQRDAQDAVFVGWSLGGHVVLEAAEDLPEARGFFILGAPPVATAADLGRALSDDPALGAAFRESSSPEEVRAYLRCFFAPGVAVAEPFADDFGRTHGAARAVLAASAARNAFRNEIEVVARSQKPLAVVHGELDRIVNRAYLDEVSYGNLWRGEIQEMAGIGHTPHWEAPAAFDTLLEAFVRDCARPS